MAQEKDRQEPIIIEIVGNNDNDNDKVGASFGGRGTGLAVSIGDDKASKRLLDKNFQELAGKNEFVRVLDVTAGKEYKKDENWKDVAPEKKMTEDVRKKAGDLIKRMGELILKKFTSTRKKVLMGAVIALAATSLFAGGLGKEAQTTLQKNYSTMNPKFADGYGVLIDYNARTQGMLGNFTQDFLIEVFKDKLNEIKKEKNLEGDFDKIARKCAEKFSDAVEATRYNDDRGIFAEVKINQDLVDKESRGVVDEMVKLGFLTESKGNEKVKASQEKNTISVSLQIQGGKITSDSTYTDSKGVERKFTKSQLDDLNNENKNKGIEATRKLAASFAQGGNSKTSYKDGLSH